MPFFENRAVYQVIWDNIFERGRSQMIIWRMRIACWITKATITLSEYVAIFAFPLRQWTRLNLPFKRTLPALLDFSTEIARLYLRSGGSPCFCRAA
jgi:hypothetical protein